MEKVAPKIAVNWIGVSSLNNMEGVNSVNYHSNQGCLGNTSAGNTRREIPGNTIQEIRDRPVIQEILKKKKKKKNPFEWL